MSVFDHIGHKIHHHDPRHQERQHKLRHDAIRLADYVKYLGPGAKDMEKKVTDGFSKTRDDKNYSGTAAKSLADTDAQFAQEGRKLERLTTETKDRLKTNKLTHRRAYKEHIGGWDDAIFKAALNCAKIAQQQKFKLSKHSETWMALTCFVQLMQVLKDAAKH